MSRWLDMYFSEFRRPASDEKKIANMPRGGTDKTIKTPFCRFCRFVRPSFRKNFCCGSDTAKLRSRSC